MNSFRALKIKGRTINTLGGGVGEIEKKKKLFCWKKNKKVWYSEKKFKKKIGLPKKKKKIIVR